MNVVSNMAVFSSRRPIFGLQVCDLNWSEAFTFVSALADVPIGQTAISFLNAHNANLMLKDPAYREVLSRHLVLPDGKAMKYGIGVGRDGFTWSGQHKITRKAEWPDWTPPAAMRKRVPDLPAHMPGGPKNPLGARALYIGSTLYRLHGTSEPWTIGQAVSSGCIRLTNEDIIDLYDRTKVGATVVVRH